MKSKAFRVDISGPLAVFTRPEMKAERFSYEVMTPSAARGILEAVFWKPAIRWVVESIGVLSPIQWTSFRRNEVNSRASPQMAAYFADEDRAQRNTVALKDVRYGVVAHMQLTEKVGPDDNMPKFEDMFSRRLAKGQTFHQPYLGCREMAADVRPAESAWLTQKLTRPLGLMFFDFHYATTPPRPLFFNASLGEGVLRVPLLEDVLKENGVTP